MLHTPRRTFTSQYTPRDLPIRLHGAVRESIVDGPRLRFVIFVQGCPHHCPGCHNPQTHDFAGGKEVDTDLLLTDILKNPFVKAVTLSGGEPFCQPAALAELAAPLKEKGYHLMCYTGYTFEHLLEKAEEKGIKLILDGVFVLVCRV